MKTKSCKAKGRALQQTVCDVLLECAGEYGLEKDDIQNRSMGANGVDVILSPAARSLFGPLAIECKNQQTINLNKVFLEHQEKYKAHLPLLVSKRNHEIPLVTMTLADFTVLLRKVVNYGVLTNSKIQ